MAQPDEPYWRPPVRGWPRAGSVFSGAIAASAIAVGVAALAQGVPEADGAPAPEATTGISQDAQGADLQRRLVSDVGSLLATHCLDCHGPTKSKGGVRFDAIAGKDATLAVALDMADDLSMARELVRTGEMPPKDRPRPTEHERLILDQWLEAALKYVPPDATPDPGWFTIHRLNRTEYRNTLRDLLGIDPAEFDVAARLPRDDTGYGFDNIADVLTVSPLSVEQYVDAAEAAIERALGPVVEVGDTPRAITRLVATTGGGPGSDGGVFLTSNGAARGEFVVPVTGDYMIRVHAWEDHGGPDNARMSVRVDGKEAQAFEITATRGDPQIVEVRRRLKAGKRVIEGAFTNDFWDPGKADRNLAVELITIAGPLDEKTTRRPKAWAEVIGWASTIEDESSRASSILERFATRAYRRPVGAEELSPLVELYTKQKERVGHEGAVRIALTAVLVSPRFLYRSVANPDAADPEVVYQLDGYELASRLSYFLWSSMPDAALMEAAASGEILSDDGLREQVQRMLRDSKAGALTENFAGQWLHLRSLDAIAFDSSRFPTYDEALRKDLVTEANLYIANLLHGVQGSLDAAAGGDSDAETSSNVGTLLDLLTSDYSFLNERLAKLYGVEGVEGKEFRRVTFPAGSARGGVLTMGGVLAVTSHPTRTSPVKRGLFVLDEVLGTPPPPPPADIPPLEQAAANKEHATLREQLAAHVADPTCAACHNRLDPIGLAFENFDAVGAWRDTENGQPIDASGTLPGGERLGGVADLKKFLAGRQDQFVETLAAKVLTYALGRGMEAFDRPAVHAIAGRVAASGYRLGALVEEVALSETFRSCRGREARDE